MWNPGETLIIPCFSRHTAYAHGRLLTTSIEIFLPSYIDCDYVPLENRREPVHDIVLSDEEVKNMLPQ